MPSLIFDEIKSTLHKTGKAFGIVKYSAKNGNYFWTIDYFEVKFNTKGNVDSYFVKRKFLSLAAKKEIEVLYEKLNSIELHSSKKVAKKYMYGFLENIEKTYFEYVLNLFQLEENEILNYFNAKTEVLKNNVLEKKELGIIERALL